MLKKLVFLLLPIIAIGCNSESIKDSPKPPQEPESVSSNIRSEAEATALAQDLYSALHNDGRAELPEIADVSVICNHNSRSEAMDTLIYAIDFADNAGYALISAPKNVIPILGISDDGAFNSNGCKTNANFQFFLEKAKKFVSVNSSYHDSRYGVGDIIGIGGMNPIKIQDQRGPRVKVKWNQLWPENIYCPNKKAGCFPVALAQAMSFFEYPTNVYLSFDNLNTRLSLNWEEIKKHKQSLDIKEPTEAQINEHYESYACKTSYAHHDALAQLIREIGHTANVSYRTQYEEDGLLHDRTGISYDMILPTIKHYFQDYIIRQENTSAPYDLLWNNNVIAIIYGYGQFKENSVIKHVGHAWILDGALKITIKSNMEGAMDIVGYYVHNNFGWNGECNGFYYEGVYDTTETPEPGQIGLLKHEASFYKDISIISIRK